MVLLLLLLLLLPLRTTAIRTTRMSQQPAQPQTAAASAVQAYTLITFDVDGTLVHSTSSRGATGEPSAHSRAFSHAVGTVLGAGGSTPSQQQPIPPVAQLLPREQVSGSTDGLILLRLARASALQVPVEQSLPQLDALMESMYHYMAALPDEQVARGVEPLPGVMETLRHLAALREDPAGNNDDDDGDDDDNTAATTTAGVLCGLVTGNVEGVARRKMRATGILQTGALAPAAPEQQRRVWVGSEDLGFLGGFGSDFCSGAVDDPARNHLDRAEQIGIAVRRCRALLQVAPSSSGNPKKTKNRVLTRVVHVGGAPSNVLAAKAYAEQQHAEKSGVVVGMVATATGRYTASELREHAGESVPGKWECVVLEDGMADPLAFLEACGVAIRQR